MSSTKQKEIGCFIKPRNKLQQPQQQPQQQQQNDHRPIEEIRSASSYQPYQPPKTFKFPEIIYVKQKRSFQHHWFGNLTP